MRKREMLKTLFMVMTALSVAACNGDIEPSPIASISCVAISNEPGACKAASGPVKVSVSKPIYVGVHVKNNANKSWTGYVGAVIDSPCQGSENWTVLKPSTLLRIPPNAVVAVWGGGKCESLRKGSRSLTITLYDSKMRPQSTRVIEV